MKISRRNFVRLAGAAGTGMVISGIASCSRATGEIRLITPLDGDMLTEIDGKIQEDGLVIPVKISAAPGSRIKVNGVPAKRVDDNYVAEIRLTGYSNPIEIIEKKSGFRQTITVYQLKNYLNKYRLSLDDNIWFLKDISVNSSKYKSIFENPYMSFLKDVHDTYGTKIHINIYYQTEGFNLSQMTDKFRDEWRNNAGWLRLSFHAFQNDPDKPYITSGYEEVKRDCEMVKAQIRRFAGEELLGPVTTLHWGEAKVEGCRALRDSGYKALAGYFEFEDGKPVVSYYLDADKTEHIGRRGIWCDNSEGIIFKKIHMVINLFKLEEIIPVLDKLKTDSQNLGFVDLMIHEQYFYPHYVDYQPDFREKVMTAIKWAYDNGYKPAFLSECLFG